MLKYYQLISKSSRFYLHACRQTEKEKKNTQVNIPSQIIIVLFCMNYTHKYQYAPTYQLHIFRRCWMGQKLWKIFACIGAPSRSAFYKLNKVDCTLFRQSEMDAFCTSLSSFLLGERGRENKLGNACLPGQPTASTYSLFFAKIF